MSILKSIRTNIITGFLGVGKTTAIQYLLANKPETERWAVLVNEFGEIGIDAAILNNDESDEVFLREVPGGCMCCAAGLPMQIALNQLIQRAKPDRLLIEPTGLGHPREVISVLHGEHYRGVLDLRATLTLVDARKISDSRYTDHDTFNQQLQVADILIAHKQDRYTAKDLPQLSDYLATQGLANTPLYSVTQGQLDSEWLDSAMNNIGVDTSAKHHHEGSFELGSLLQENEIPACGYLRRDNKGEGFCSSGWIFEPNFEFEFDGVENLLIGLNVERLKAVFITTEGVFAFNLADGVLTMQDLDETMDSRIEVIGSDPTQWAELETQLLSIAERF